MGSVISTLLTKAQVFNITLRSSETTVYEEQHQLVTAQQALIRSTRLMYEEDLSTDAGDDDDDLDELSSETDNDEDLIRHVSVEAEGDAELGSQRLMSVFRMLVGTGQINLMSSGAEESYDDDDDSHEYNDLPEQRRIRPPNQIYSPDLGSIQRNDISFAMKDVQYPSTTTFARQSGYGISNAIVNRELGITRSLAGGFGTKEKTSIVGKFLPNSLRKITNYGYKAFCGTYSVDGSIFLTAAQDRIIHIYDTSRGQFKEMKKIAAKDVGWSILDTAFSPDGQYVAYSSWSESIHICKIDGDIDTHESLSLVPDSRRFCIFSIAFSDNGNEILGGANDGYIYAYNRELKKRVLKIGAHNEDCNSVAFADEATHVLFSAADDSLIKVWDRRCLNESAPKPVGILAGHIDGITFVDSKHDGRYLVTNSKDQSIKLWDLRVFSTGDAIVACKDVMDKNRWDYRWQQVPKRLCANREQIQGDASVMTYRGHSVLNTLIRCRFSPHSTNQRFIYTGCAAGRVVIYDILTAKVLKVLDGHEGCVRDVSWHPYLPEIVSTSWDGSVGLWTRVSQHALCDTDAEILGITTNPNPVSNRKRSRASNCGSKYLTSFTS